jgi:hypothetical protein
MIILAIVIIVLVSLYFFLVYEGFQGSTEDKYQARLASQKLIQSDTSAKCQGYTSCSKCLADQDCGWASDYAEPVKGMPNVKDGTILACIPQEGGKPFITSNLADLITIKGGAKNLTNFINTLSKCKDVNCADNTKCSTCAYYEKCTWQQVTASDGSVKQTCLDTSASGSGSTTVNNITTASMCPPPQCSDVTDCTMCANTTGCSFCASSGKCLKNSEFGTGVNQCSEANKVNVPAKCPCGPITDCGACADRAGCGYCKKSSSCVNLDNTGLPPAGTCTPDDIITSSSQCKPPDKKLAAPVDTRTAKDPTAAEIYAAGNSGNLEPSDPMNMQTNIVRPESEYTTTAAKKFSMITSPGVAIKVGAGAIPAAVRTDNGLDTPLETYVKELVNSQLAAQGVPMNEPFQVNESAAIPNASDYLKKVFRGVFS